MSKDERKDEIIKTVEETLRMFDRAASAQTVISSGLCCLLASNLKEIHSFIISEDEE